jgi:hypothetical protein
MLFDIFFPASYFRMYLQSLGALLLIIILFCWSDIAIRQQLRDNPVQGKIIDVKVGSKGGGVGKYSGRSTHYHIQLDGFKRNFLLEDASVFENWQFGRDDIKIGDQVAFKIKAIDEKKLQQPTEYIESGQQQIPWPQASSSIKMYGIDVNRKTILSSGSSIRGETYNRWFWVMIPLFIYALVCLFVRTRFKYWTQDAEDKFYAEK